MTTQDKIARAIRDQRTCTNWPQMDDLARKVARIFGYKGAERERFIELASPPDGRQW